MCKLILEAQLPLYEFLKLARSYVTENLNEIPFNDLGDILLTYILANQDYKLARKAEKRILKERRKLTVEDCISLMNTYMLYESSENIWTTFDLIIGRNIKKVENSDIIPIITMFSKSPFRREKIFRVFVHKIKAANFSTSELCNLAKIYGDIEYSQDDIFEYLDNKLAYKVHEMKDEDATNCLIGFLSPSIQAHYRVMTHLERHVEEIIPKISLPNASILLLRYGQLRKGSQTMVNSCIARIKNIFEKDVTDPKLVEENQLLMILYAYNLVGADGKLNINPLNSI